MLNTGSYPQGSEGLHIPHQGNLVVGPGAPGAEKDALGLGYPPPEWQHLSTIWPLRAGGAMEIMRGPYSKPA